MRKDESGLSEWVKHTRNVYGGRRRVNKANRRNAKRKLRRPPQEFDTGERRVQ